MEEQRRLVSRLLEQKLHSISALRQLGSVFADEFSRLLHEHNEHVQQFHTTQTALDEARLWFASSTFLGPHCMHVVHACCYRWPSFTGQG